MAISAVPISVFASSTGSTSANTGIGEDKVQNAKTQYSEITDSDTQTAVYLTVDDSDLIVSLPTTVIVSGTPDSSGNYTGNYSVGVKGNMSGSKQVNIVPDENVSLTQKGKNSKEATITQQQTVFTTDDFKNDTVADGAVTAEGLTAGSWNGKFNFNISMSVDSSWHDITSQIDIMNAKVGYWDRYGYQYETSGYHYINIPVTSGEQYKISGTAPVGNPRLVLLKKALGLEESISMLPTKDINSKTEYTDEQITIPDGCNWMCISVSDGTASTLKLEKLGNGIVNKQQESNFYWDFGGNKYMTITIDDSLSDVDQYIAVLNKYNVPGNFATLVEQLNVVCPASGKTVKEELLTAQANGSEILTHYSKDLTSSSPDSEYELSYVTNKSILESNGFVVNGYITSGGSNYKTQNWDKSLAACKRAGYLYADLSTRGNDIYNKRYYNSRTCVSDAKITNGSTYKTMDAITAAGEGWFNCYTHGSTETSIENFEALIKYAQENGFKIVTWKTVYDNCGRTRM